MKRVVHLNGEEIRVDLARVSGVSWTELEPGVYSVLAKDVSYEVRVADGVVEIDGRIFEAEVIDPRNQATGGQGAAAEGRRNVTSPMPGKVVRVLVEEGAEVEAGQGLVVVEAMKMQNEMKAPKAGRVVVLSAKAGASVAAGEILVTLE